MKTFMFICVEHVKAVYPRGQVVLCLVATLTLIYITNSERINVGTKIPKASCHSDTSFKFTLKKLNPLA